MEEWRGELRWDVRCVMCDVATWPFPHNFIELLATKIHTLPACIYLPISFQRPNVDEVKNFHQHLHVCIPSGILNLVVLVETIPIKGLVEGFPNISLSSSWNRWSDQIEWMDYLTVKYFLFPKFSLRLTFSHTSQSLEEGVASGNCLRFTYLGGKQVSAFIYWLGLLTALLTRLLKC